VKKSWIGIALGDVTGIGPEITLKALAELPEDSGPFLILGDPGLLKHTQRQLGLSLDLRPFAEDSDDTGRFFFHNCLDQPLPARLPQGDARAAQAAIAWLRDGAERCLHSQLQALVTAPLNKAAVIRAGFSFVGQTEFLSQLCQTDRTAMMLLGADDRGRWLRVTLVTTHVPLRLVSDRIDHGKIIQTIELTAEACSRLGLQRQRVGVCGLNPHAGEEGQLGVEDRDIIIPAVQAMRARHFDVHGPLPADTLFHQAWRGDYDAVVAMYHDQGLAPLKMVAFEQGINWTLGLPFVRVSPDHGTAYDIAGKGLANPSSMKAAIQLARSLTAAQ
jgi:4-hydroxythreonine-4-phosphate dehydrogenase